jgi:hypothetical protein
MPDDGDVAASGLIVLSSIFCCFFELDESDEGEFIEPEDDGDEAEPDGWDIVEPAPVPGVCAKIGADKSIADTQIGISFFI